MSRRRSKLVMRYSLRTLLILTLLAGPLGATAFQRYEAWQTKRRLAEEAAWQRSRYAILSRYRFTISTGLVTAEDLIAAQDPRTYEIKAKERCQLLADFLADMMKDQEAAD